MAQRKSFLDEVSSGIGAAVSDVRSKLEEVIWGREVTERDTQTGPQWPQAREPESSFGGLVRNIDVGPTREMMQENANFRLAALEKELNGPQWPQAREGQPAHTSERERGPNIDDRERGSDIER